MTREELRDEVAHALIECRGDGCGSFEMADAILRLVVEACCARLRNPDKDADYAWHGEVLDDAADDLRSTFLPTEKPDGE